MNWKVGDRAIVVNVTGESTYMNGCYCNLVHELPLQAQDFAVSIDGCPSPHPEKLWALREDQLIPIPDDYTRFHEALIASKWSDCEWTPFVTVEGDNDLP